MKEVLVLVGAIGLFLLLMTLWPGGPCPVALHGGC